MTRRRQAVVARGARHDAGGVDFDELMTKADLTIVAADLYAEMAAMEVRLSWRLAGAMAVIGAILRFID